MTHICLQEYFERQRLRSGVNASTQQQKVSASIEVKNDNAAKRKSESQDIILFRRRNSAKRGK